MSQRKKPAARPRKPERKPARARRDPAPATPSPDGMIKAGWRLCVWGGLIIGLLAALFVATIQDRSTKLVGITAIFGSYLVAAVLSSTGGLALAVLCIIAMVRGAVGRGLLLLLAGPAIGVILAAGLPLGTAALLGNLHLKESPKRPVTPVRHPKAATNR